jgi:hypothetical protein
MWLLEFMLLSLVGGTILGVGWRLFDDWRERAGRDTGNKQ